MKVNSTGLGKTTMVAGFTEIRVDPETGNTLKLRVDASEPIHWVITITLGGKDMRRFIGLLLNPSILLKALVLLIKGTTA
jgi:hypothetical protein